MSLPGKKAVNQAGRLNTYTERGLVGIGMVYDMPPNHVLDYEGL